MNTIKDLIKELSKFDENLPIHMVASIVEHSCGPDEYCYCSADEVEFYIESVSRKLGKGKNVVGVSLIISKR